MLHRSWYTHRFNGATSLRLIRGVIPRVPRPLVPPMTGDRETDLRDVATRDATTLERVVRQHPEQAPEAAS